jgi:hypothetical protein
LAASRGAGSGGEHKILVVPSFAGGVPVLILALFVGLEGVDGHVGEGQGPACSCWPQLASAAGRQLGRGTQHLLGLASVIGQVLVHPAQDYKDAYFSAHLLPSAARYERIARQDPDIGRACPFTACSPCQRRR